MKLLDIGEVLGDLTIVSVDHTYQHSRPHYECRCSCGGSRMVRVNRWGIYKDCGGVHHKFEKSKAEACGKLNIPDGVVLSDVTSNNSSAEKGTFSFKFACNGCGFNFDEKYATLYGKGFSVNCPFCTGSPIKVHQLADAVKLLSYKLLEVYEDRGIKMLKLECENGHIRNTNMGYLKYRPSCVECNPSKSAPLTDERLIASVEGKGFKYHGRRAEGHLTHVTVECANGHIWTPLHSNFIKPERGCPYCSLTNRKTKDMFFYLQEIVGEDEHLYYKYGVTKNEPQLRLNKQEKSSGLSHELVAVAQVKREIAVSLEAWLKKNLEPHDFGFKFDGYTEVVSANYREFLYRYILNSWLAEGKPIEGYVDEIRSYCE